MPRTYSLPSYGALGAPAETYMSFWRGMFQASSDAAMWWTRRWLDAPTTFMDWSPLRYAAPKPADGPAPQPKSFAAVIDLARARAVAETADQAAQVVEIAETAAEVPVSIAEDSISVATKAAEVLEPEDLTRLVGIGPKLAASLARLGVTRYAQIAAWTTSDLGKFDKVLDLKGRAVRDAWVAQAKRFASETA